MAVRPGPLMLVAALGLAAGCGPSSPLATDGTCRWLATETGFRQDPAVLVVPVPPDSQLVGFVLRNDPYLRAFGPAREALPDAEREARDAADRASLRERLAPLDSLRDSADLWIAVDDRGGFGWTGVVAVRSCEIVEAVQVFAIG